MNAFDYSHSADPVREDLSEAYRRAWEHISAPGTWLTGAERVAVAEETRRARSCALCAERKAALSPFTVDGEHEQAGVLPTPMADEVHRVTMDAARLTQAWHDSLIEEGLSEEAYVEALGVVGLVVSIDEFQHAMGLAFEPLPDPKPGEPSQYRPRGAVEGDAWVPMLDPKQTDEAERQLIAVAPGGDAPNIIRALSLVPDQVRALMDLHAAQYLSVEQMRGFETGRALNRPQMELVAGRVSALNECFY